MGSAACGLALPRMLSRKRLVLGGDPITMMAHTLRPRVLLSLVLALGAVAPAGAVDPWCTYRGNEQRTGNTDGIAGPKQPKVLWVVKSNDHYIASPVPWQNRLYISGLGSFNVAHFICLSTDPDAKERTLW